jgi:hypothetical protein
MKVFAKEKRLKKVFYVPYICKNNTAGYTLGAGAHCTTPSLSLNPL